VNLSTQLFEMRPRLYKGQVVGAKAQKTPEVLRICRCTSHSCGAGQCWDPIHSTQTRGSLIGLKEFEDHKREDQRIAMLASSGLANYPVSDSVSSHTTESHPSSSGKPIKAKDAQRVRKSTLALLLLQDKLSSTEAKFRELVDAPLTLTFLHRPSSASSTANTMPFDSEELNTGPMALQADNATNRDYLSHEQILLQILADMDELRDHGDNVLAEAKHALREAVEAQFSQLQEVKKAEWARQKKINSCERPAVQTGK
jgi:hypothetical protein